MIVIQRHGNSPKKVAFSAATGLFADKAPLIKVTTVSIALLKYHNIATFIGQETGSTYLNSDNIKTLSLTNTNLKLNYSTQIVEVDALGLEAGEGIQADYEIIPTIEDLLNNTDKVLEFTINLIHHK